jgi:hypothetical protein
MAGRSGLHGNQQGRDRRPAAMSVSPSWARSRGLLVVQRAMLLDAAADLATLERRMAAARSDGSATLCGVAAVDLLDRIARLLETQHAAMVDQLTEVLRSAPGADDEPEPVVHALWSIPGGRARGMTRPST